MLSDVDRARWDRDGYLFPIRVMSESRAVALRGELERFEASQGGAIKGDIRWKTYLVLRWMDELIRDPAVLEPVVDLLGPDVFVWGTDFFVKEPGSDAYVSWHQDATYWGLDPADVLTAWVALAPSTRASGGLRVVPGSHRRGQVPHQEGADTRNMLSRAQEIRVDVDEADAVDIELAPGEMSLHHVLMVHSSPPNRSDDRRVGIAIRYMPTRVRKVDGPSESAMLVHGTDVHGHFLHEPRVVQDMDEAALKAHREAIARLGV